MKFICTLSLIITFLFSSISSQAQNWFKTIGGTGTDIPYAIAQDASKNIFIGGAFNGTNINFNPGGTAITITATGIADNGFFAKYNATGILQWAIPYVNTGGGTRVTSVVPGAAGDVYVAGWMDGSNTNFNPLGTPMNVSTSGAQDIFLAKYNSAGICQWVRIMGGSAYSDQATGVAYDATESTVVLVGQFISTTNFNPGGTAMNYSPNGTVTAGNSDIFIAKYNTSGICQWVRQIGAGNNSDVCNGVAIDNSGNIIIGGWYNNANVNFNPAGTAVTRSISGTSSDMYLAKYNNTGILQWVLSMGGTNVTDAVNGVATDGSGNVYAAGNFAGTSVNFNPGGTAVTYTATGTDAFVAKYNSAGVLQWGKPSGGSSSDRGRCVAVANDGTVVFGGQFNGTNINFNAGGTAYPLTSSSTDCFIMSYNSAGAPNWGMAVGGTGSDDMKSFAVDNASAKIFAAGQFNGTNANFDPLNSTATTGTSSATDLFVARYNMSDGHLSLTVSTLPVSWTKIDVARVGDKVLLSWETSCEVNNSGFAIERSTDGTHFQFAGYMASTAAADCGKASYLFEDRVNGIEGKIYYRLKQMDIDGKHSYSKTVMLSDNSNEKMSVQVSPNPARNNFSITRSGNNAPDKAVIYSTGGKLMTRITLGSYTHVDCSAYAPGIYYINYFKGDKLMKSDKVVINR